MAKKNFDAFIKAAGKKPKPTPEEVEAMAKQLHQTAATPQAIAVDPPAAPVAKLQKTAVPTPKMKTASTKKTVAEAQPIRLERGARSAGASKEKKVRITIDLAKDLYKRMKLAVVQNETEISAYVRMLIENDLSRK